MSIEIEGVKRAEVVRLLPDDVIVVECDRALHPEQKAQIKQCLESVWPHHRSVVLDVSLTLKVVRPEELEV